VSLLQVLVVALGLPLDPVDHRGRNCLHYVARASHSNHRKLETLLWLVGFPGGIRLLDHPDRDGRTPKFALGPLWPTLRDELQMQALRSDEAAAALAASHATQDWCCLLVFLF
jgi:hypothetical protein